jgi:hypothetical protein
MLCTGTGMPTGYRTYIITVRRITSGELLKQRKGLRIRQRYGRAEIWEIRHPMNRKTLRC